ncbi:MAG: hypothetical protein V1742_06680 [Pseudomonadota bacterium]
MGKGSYLALMAAVAGFLFFMTCLPGPARAGEPEVVMPAVEMPIVRPVLVVTPLHEGQCNPGFTWKTYEGKEVCLRCLPGFIYAKFEGHDKCVQCPPDFDYAQFEGKERCIKCKPGFAYTTHEGKERCVK